MSYHVTFSRLARDIDEIAKWKYIKDRLNELDVNYFLNAPEGHLPDSMHIFTEKKLTSDEMLQEIKKEFPEATLLRWIFISQERKGEFS